jgi:hypothetical protein
MEFSGLLTCVCLFEDLIIVRNIRLALLSYIVDYSSKTQ